MDLVTLLIVLVIFGLVSFVIEKFWGINPYKVYIAVGIFTFVISIFYIAWPVLTNSSDISSLMTSLSRFTKWLTDFLPGALIGDIAGIIIGKFTR